MLSNHEQRRKRIVDGAHVSAMNSIYKFNQEETSYDRVMRVLNSQQNRITNMLKKYGQAENDDDPSYQHNITASLTPIEEPASYFNPRTHQTISNLEEASVKSVRLSAKSQQKQDYSFGEEKIIRRLESSMPLRKKSDMSRNMYNMYGYSDLDLPRLPQAKLPRTLSKPKKKSRKDLSLITNERRSKHEVIQSLYTDKKSAKQQSVQSKSKKTRRIDKDLPPQTGLPLEQFTEEQQPLSEQSESETDEQEPVPLPQYYKEFREIVRKQTVEQMNFLYFSKNQTMKNWTESILTMFEKHDKELRQLRKRTRYLQSFDQHFFTADAFVQ